MRGGLQPTDRSRAGSNLTLPASGWRGIDRHSARPGAEEDDPQRRHAGGGNLGSHPDAAGYAGRFSHEKVGETIGEYLLEKGYRRPGLLWAGDARATLRKQGLRARLAKNGIDDAPQVEVPLPASLALGRRGLAELLAGGEFDVIVCSSDTLAQGAIMEAESRGLRVPQDLAVIGFGDLDFAASNRPAITTVSVDRHAIGEQAATLLADRIEGGEEGEAIIDIGFHLVARESA